MVGLDGNPDCENGLADGSRCSVGRTDGAVDELRTFCYNLRCALSLTETYHALSIPEAHTRDLQPNQRRLLF